MDQFVSESPEDSDLKDGDHSLLSHADDIFDDDDEELLENHSPIPDDHALLVFHEMPKPNVDDSVPPMRSHSPPPLPSPPALSPPLPPPSLSPPSLSPPPSPPPSSMELTTETMAAVETESNPVTTTPPITAHESRRRSLSQPLQNAASDIIASLPFTSSSTDGVVNRRLSWAERRLDGFGDIWEGSGVRPG